MRLLPILTFAILAVAAPEASAQQRNRERSPERQAQHDVCREEAGRVYRGQGGRNEQDRLRMQEMRRAYVRDCMQKTRRQ